MQAIEGLADDGGLVRSARVDRDVHGHTQGGTCMISRTVITMTIMNKCFPETPKSATLNSEFEYANSNPILN